MCAKFHAFITLVTIRSLSHLTNADAWDNIQLEVEYKAYLNRASKGGTGPSIQEKRKSTVEQFKRAKTLGEDINREDLREEDLAAPDMVIFKGHDSYDWHNASVTGTNVSEGRERSGRYRPLRSKCFLNRLNRAIEDKEATKAKILESASTALSRTYTVVHYQLVYTVLLGTNPSCDCADYIKNSGKELCKLILWIYLFLCKIPVK